MDISIFILTHATSVTRKHQLFTAKPSEWKEYVPGETNLLLIHINLRIDLEKWFRETGYPEEIVNKETKQALESSLGSSNNKTKNITQDDRQKGVPLVVTYNAFLCHLDQTIRKNLFLLYQDEEVKRVLTPAPFLSFRTARAIDPT